MLLEETIACNPVRAPDEARRPVCGEGQQPVRRKAVPASDIALCQPGLRKHDAVSMADPHAFDLDLFTVCHGAPFACSAANSARPALTYLVPDGVFPEANTPG